MKRCVIGLALAKEREMTMKTNEKKKTLMFGDFIAAAFRACGKQKAINVVRRAVNEHLVKFRGQQCFVIS